MAETPQIVLPHGGYKNLIVYRKSDAIYQGTVVFCRRFLPKFGDRTVDQMTQAARSCKQNIAEGSASSGTSKETEIKLTNVARATLDELLEDYLDYLKSHEGAEWPARSEKKTAAREYAKEHSDWADWQKYFEKRSAADCCNAMIVIIQQTKYMLDKMIKRQEEDFKKFGGVRERMHAARTAARAEEWDAAIYSRLDAAASVEELRSRLAEVKRRANQSATAIARRKGWLMSLSSLASFVSLLSLLSFSPAARAAGELPEGATVHVAPLTRAMWNQGRHYNLMCPTTASGGNDGRMWAGCTAVATGILVKYYEWPAEGETFYQDLNDEKSWQNDYTSISLRARFDKPYDWSNMQDVYGNVTSARASLAVAQLVSDIGAVMHMDYGTDGSSTLRENVTGVLEHNFHFDASDLYELDSSRIASNQHLIQAQLSAGHPIISAGAAGASGTGHTYVCDGYATTDPSRGSVTNLYHFNFGWGGTSNGWYPLDAVFTQAKASDTPYSRPVETMILGVLPQKSPLIRSASQVSGPDVTVDWSIAKCWTNGLDGIAVERQVSQPVQINQDLTDCWNIRSDGWGWRMSEGLPIAYAKYSYSGSWPTQGINANTTNAVAVSASSTVRISYSARKFSAGVKLYLIKSNLDGLDYDENYQDFPTLAELPGGTSTSSFTDKTVEITGSVLEEAFGNEPAIFALKFVGGDGDSTYYSQTDVFKLKSFTVTGEGKSWVTVESRELPVGARSVSFTGLDAGDYNFNVVARYGSIVKSASVERKVVPVPRTPVVTVGSLSGNVLTFNVAGTDDYSYRIVTQSNAARGSALRSGSSVLFTLANPVADVGTHWVTLYVTDNVTGAEGKCVYITNPPEDHPLLDFVEPTFDAAVVRAKSERKLVLLLSTGADETKFENLSGILSSNQVVNVVRDKYVLVESCAALPSGYDLARKFWRVQPAASYGGSPAPYLPQANLYAYIIDPYSPDVPIPGQSLPTDYALKNRWAYLNSQLDIAILSYPSSVVQDLDRFLAQDFGIRFPAGGTMFIVW